MANILKTTCFIAAMIAGVSAGGAFAQTPVMQPGTPAPAQQPQGEAPVQGAQTAPAAPVPSGEAAARGGTPAWMNFHGYGSREENIGTQHVTNSEILTWSQQTAVELLSFTPDTYAAQFEKNREYFTPAGYTAYDSYLQQSGLSQRIIQQRQSASAVVNGNATIVRAGQFGRPEYRWLVSMPVVVSFFRPSEKTEDAATLISNGSFELYLQVVRVPRDKDSFNSGGETDMDNIGVAVENWIVKPVTP